MKNKLDKHYKPTDPGQQTPSTHTQKSKKKKNYSKIFYSD